MISQAHREIRDLAKEFARREVAPYAGDWDKQAELPMQVVKSMADIGLLGMTAQVQWGGIEADSVSLALAVEAIASADATLALVLSMANSLSILTLMKHRTPGQREQWMKAIVSGERIASFAITESHAGSDPTKMTARAERKGDRYLI